MTKPHFTFHSNYLKNYFLTGLVVLLPITLTVMIVSFLFNLLTSPFEGMVTPFLASIGAPADNQTLLLFSKVLILVLLLTVTLLLGALARWFFVNWIIRLGEKIVNRIPLIGAIYKTSQDVIRTIFTSQAKSFKQVVLAPYPSKGTYVLGLITRDLVANLDKKQFGERVCVFIATTPNPTSGFLLLYEKSDLIYLDMAIEDALKFIISCGVIASPIRPTQKNSDVQETIS